MDTSKPSQRVIDDTQHVTNKLMLMAARRSSVVVDTFLSWLLAGAGAFIGLLIGNLGSLAKYLSPVSVKAAAVIFLAAAACGVAQKYLASVTQGSAEAASEAANLAEDTSNAELEVDLELMYREFEAVAYPATRWIMRKFGVGFRPSSPLSTGQRLSKQAQIQSFLAMATTTLIFVAFAVIVCGLGG